MNEEKQNETSLKHSVLCSLLRNGFDGRENLRQRFAAEKSKNAFDKLVRAWIETEDVMNHDLPVIPGARSYLTLGKRGCKAVDAPTRLCRPVPESELPYELGCLAYTSMRKPYRKRLLPKEVKSRFSFIEDKHLRWGYLVEYADKTPLLTTIRVEHRAAVDAVLSKVTHQLENFREHAEFARFLDTGRFKIVVIAATKEKAVLLEKSFREHPGFITPRQRKEWFLSKQGSVRIEPVYYPPLLTL